MNSERREYTPPTGEQLRTGGQTVFEEFYRHANPKLNALGEHLAKGHGEDLSHEAWEALLSAESDIVDPHAFLHSIVRNKAASLHRKGGVHGNMVYDTGLAEDASRPSDDDVATKVLLNMEIEAGLRSLPSAEREIAYLTGIRDLPGTEVAEKLGINQGTVKAQLNRVRRKLSINRW